MMSFRYYVLSRISLNVVGEGFVVMTKRGEKVARQTTKPVQDKALQTRTQVDCGRSTCAISRTNDPRRDGLVELFPILRPND